MTESLMLIGVTIAIAGVIPMVASLFLGAYFKWGDRLGMAAAVVVLFGAALMAIALLRAMWGFA